MEKIGFHNLRTCSDGPMGRPGASVAGTVMASFEFEQDVEFLFPYINAMARHCEFHKNFRLLRFKFEGSHCVLYPEKCIISPLRDQEHAKAFVSSLMEFLNSILEKKEEIFPKSRPFEPVPVTEIIKILPRTNCGECGMKTCMAFAAMLSKHRAHPRDCPYMAQPVREQITYPVLDKKGRPLSQVTFQVDPASPSFDAPHSPLDRKEPPPAPDRPKPPSDTISITQSHPGNVQNTALPDPLSPRELEVLSHMGRGLTNREISDSLFISPHTVKTHVVNIFNKLGVNHRTQAVVWAARQGII